jgi:hypothetical protein
MPVLNPVKKRHAAMKKGRLTDTICLLNRHFILIKLQSFLFRPFAMNKNILPNYKHGHSQSTAQIIAAQRNS